MNKALISIIVTAVVLTSTSAFAKQLTVEEAQQIVKPFYDLFSLKDTELAARANMSADWQSYYNNTEYKNLDETMQAVAHGFPKMIPDMKWTQDDIGVTTTNQVVVRGTLTGTPAGDSFFGQPVDGKSFSIMTIDIHQIEDGKIIRSHHIEDWFRGLGQLQPDVK
ncbi:ester cyclase [Vibrio sp. D404a]|uniref:ester cyclase n=1 Tax=unclassified Vibrio TaxID=2614977 RepID=UPI00255329ED|nr:MULTISPECIES: ester cyclase [unclassified Vibrio]MDK9739450.1 ester cyclase [Vibrio sp. D404a]MDK9798930.1 ester cyclase [Vibrio sp. D449a]